MCKRCLRLSIGANLGCGAPFVTVSKSHLVFAAVQNVKKPFRKYLKNCIKPLLCSTGLWAKAHEGLLLELEWE